MGWFPTERDAVQWAGPAIRHPVDAAQLSAMVVQGRGSPPDRRCWMVRDDDGIVGHAQLAYDWRHGNASLSRVAVAPDRRGHGLAVPLVTLLIRRAFDEPSIERIELNVYAWNAPALRTYERAGFRHEGVRRSSARIMDERWDTAIMGLLRPDWHPRRSSH